MENGRQVITLRQGVESLSYGKINSSIEIMEKVSDKDSAGFSAPTYKTLASVRAYREERHAGKRWANIAAFSTATVLFVFRAIPTLKVTDLHFISDGENIYNIDSANDINGRGMYIEAFAEMLPRGSVR